VTQLRAAYYEQLPNMLMDEGLGHLDKQRGSVADAQAASVVDQEELTTLSTSLTQSGAYKPQVQPSATELPEGVLPIGQQIIRTSNSLEVSHASPLAPLRRRDSHALDDLFKHDRLQEITLDVHRYLARTYPEPCWEDDPYEFLNGYT